MRGWLKESRLKNGLTMKEMADKIGIGESYYSMIESGKRAQKMDVTLVLRLSHALGISTKQIIEYENN